MTGSMISGVSAFTQPVVARFVDPTCERPRDVLPKHQAHGARSLSR